MVTWWASHSILMAYCIYLKRSLSINLSAYYIGIYLLDSTEHWTQVFIWALLLISLIQHTNSLTNITSVFSLFMCICHKTQINYTFNNECTYSEINMFTGYQLRDKWCVCKPFCIYYIISQYYKLILLSHIEILLRADYITLLIIDTINLMVKMGSLAYRKW